MTEKDPLEAMLRRPSRMAENMFERDGEVTAFWLAETADGRQQTILTPMDVPPEVSVAEAKVRVGRDHPRRCRICGSRLGRKKWSYCSEVLASMSASVGANTRANANRDAGAPH